MKKTVFFISIISLIASVLPSLGAPLQVSIDDIRAMIRRGDLEDATAALDSISYKQPKNAEVDLLRGQMLMAEFNDSAAIVSLTAANKKGSNDALLSLAEIATRQYRVDDAEDLLDRYQSYIRRNPRKKLTDESGDLEERISRTRTMLDRVEDIIVIDSVNVDAESFFKAYGLAPDAGRFIDPASLGSNISAAETMPVYLTEDGRKMLWAAENPDGDLTLMSSDALLGDEWSDPAPVGDFLSLEADAAFPFLMPDGVTLYYASNGRGSLGGYDIFISRDNGNGFLEPQNLGMPYNSPYDDYLLAIDEVTGVGWWATDRNHIPGMVTIYTFIPSAMRKNVPVDDPNIAARAALSNISLTQPAGADFSSLRQAIAANRAIKSANADSFKFYLPDGRLITSLDQVNDSKAADMLRRYLQAENEFQQLQSQLSALRSQFGKGDKSVSSKILSLEQQLPAKRANLLSRRNEAIKALTR